MAFGVEQISKTTPLWAKWLFRVTFLLTTAATGYVAATNLLSQETKYEITIVLKLFVDPIVYTMSKMFGVQIKEEDAQ